MKEQMKKVAKSAVKSHEDKMHKVKKMSNGGCTSDMRKSVGRGMAKVMNQRGK